MIQATVSGEKTMIASSLKKVLGATALSAIVLTGFVTAATSPVAAQQTCNVRGPWDIIQSNGPVVRIDLRQDDSGALVGTASTSEGTVVGTASGSIQGRSFQLTI